MGCNAGPAWTSCGIGKECLFSLELVAKAKSTIPFIDLSEKRSDLFAFGKGSTVESY